MESDILLYGLIVTIFIYLSGYQAAAVLIGTALAALYFVSVLAGRAKRKPVPRGGAQFLEPVVIETTRVPPYRIPAKMDIRMHPQWGQKTFYEKVSYKTLGGAFKTVWKLFKQ